MLYISVKSPVNGFLVALAKLIYRGPSWSWVCMDGPIQNHAIERPAQFDQTMLLYHVRELGTTHGGQHLLLIKQIDLTMEGDPQFGLVQKGILKATGLLKKALRHRTNRKHQWPYGVHELVSCSGNYIGWGWWDEALYEQEVYVCPVVQYTVKFEGQFDFACLLLLKVNDTTFRRCGRGRVQETFFRDCRGISISIV